MRIQRTQRSDWLTRALETLPFTFVSGSPVSSHRMTEQGSVTLRAIAHFPPDHPPPSEREARRSWLPPHYITMQVFICVQLSDFSSVESFIPRADSNLLNFYQLLTRCSSAPVALLAFEDKKDPSEGTEAFKVTDRGLGLKNTLIQPAEYAQLLNARRAPPEARNPEVKAINRSLNDLFQWWTRSFLSPQLAINDVDAVYGLSRSSQGTKPVLFELKRSGVREWLPYLDDIPNFFLLQALSRDIGQARDLILRYEDSVPNVLDIFSIERASREAIVGYTIRVVGQTSEEVLRQTLSIAHSMDAGAQIPGGEPYISAKSRIRRF